MHQGLVEHQRDFVVEARGRRADLQGQRVAVGPVQKRCFQPLRQGCQVLDAWRATLGPGRSDDDAVGIDDKQFGKVLSLGQGVAQHRAIDLSEPGRHLLGQVGQVFPLLAHPLMQQLHAGLGDGFERLLDLRVTGPVKAARPTHAEFAGFAKPRQPTLFTRR
ncbi:hypothetical protein D9M71_294510 [compost metagenome]